MRLIFLILSVGFLVSKSNCHDSRKNFDEANKIHGYLLVGYPVKNLDSNCLKNLSGALLKNNCIIAMNEYFINVIPDFNFINDFDSIYKKDAQIESDGSISITILDRRFTGSDISYLLQDNSLKKIRKELVPAANLDTKIYFNKNAIAQSFVYRIFEFQAAYINKKIKNTSESQNLIEGMTNLVYDNVKEDTLNMYFFSSFIYLREVSPSEFQSKTFIPIN